MDWLEQELKEALGRKDPAPDFTERVRRKTRGDGFRTALWPQRWLTAAATAARQHQQRAWAIASTRGAWRRNK